MVRTVLLLGLVLAASVTDLTRHKIYNWTTYPGIVAAVGLNALGSVLAALGCGQERLRWWGWIGWERSLIGLVACGFVVLVCYEFLRVGGGDVKLMAMLGAFLGPEQGIDAMLWTFVLGAAVALVILVWRVGPWTLLVRSLRRLLWWLRVGGVPLTADERAALQPPLFLAPSALAAVVIVEFSLVDYFL